MQSTLDAAKPGTPAAALRGRVSGILGAGSGGGTPEAPQLPLEKRARQRIRAEMLLHQRNMENVTAMAFSFLSGGAAPERIQDSWLEHFYDNARLISDRSMQMVWARVLAAETNRPESFSRRAVSALVPMDRADLEMLTSIRRACVRFDRLVLFVYDLKDRIYVDNGITFSALLHLDEVGLVNFTETTEHSSITTDGLQGSVDYFDEKIVLEMAPQQRLFTGLVVLTRIGEELAGVCDAQPIAGFSGYLRRNWMLLGVKVGQLQEGTLKPSPAA